MVISVAFEGIAEEAAAVVSRVVRKITYDVHAEIVDLIRRGGRSGRTYPLGAIRRQRKGGPVVVGYRIHRASAPGEPPAVRTGNLVNSIRPRMLTPIRGEITVNAAYGQFLEEGAPRAHLAPRPYVAPAIKGVLERFERL